jgi:hypothetical protein
MTPANILPTYSPLNKDVFLSRPCGTKLLPAILEAGRGRDQEKRVGGNSGSRNSVHSSTNSLYLVFTNADNSFKSVYISAFSPIKFGNKPSRVSSFRYNGP